MKIQRVCSLGGQFYQWKLLVTFKKLSRGRRGWVLTPPPPPYAADPMLIMYPYC